MSKPLFSKLLNAKKRAFFRTLVIWDCSGAEGIRDCSGWDGVDGLAGAGGSGGRNSSNPGGRGGNGGNGQVRIIITYFEQL